MAGLVYGGKFEQMMNEFLGPQNVAATARKFQELEQREGGYAFGKFMKYFLPNPNEYSNWDKDSGEISDAVRQTLTDVVSANLKSASPLPMVLKVGENVDDTHEIHVKTFAYGGQLYVGLHMLCPSTSLK
jgi:hypothetical protein